MLKTISIDTTYGKVKGIQMDGYQVYKGLRYGTAARFQKPCLYVSEEIEYDSTKYGYTCPQPRPFEGSFYDREFWHHKEYATEENEDCLYLNIWKPDEGEMLPVALWIHGGAFVNGFGSKVEIDGQSFNQQGVILVSINYRVGILGFLCHDWLETSYGYCGNYGIYDQICAIEWVKKHICSFGGNPDNITVMGQSAGAMSVQTLISSPLLPSGVTKAVMQSGGGYENSMNDNKKIDEQKALGVELIKYLTISSLHELLVTAPKDLVMKSEEFIKARQIRNLLFAPVIHTEVLPDTYEKLVTSGKVADIPCIIGCTQNDITVANELETSPIYQGCIKWALETEKAGHVPSYVYVFKRAPLGGEGQGAFHSGDLWYSFHSLNRSWRQKDDMDYRIADEMNRRWADFIKTGSPNNDEYAQWNVYTAGHTEIKYFG